MADRESDTEVFASISYIGTVPEGEKAYHMMYGDDGPIPRTNITRIWRQTRFENVRNQMGALSFDRHGIAIHELHTAMTYQDYGCDQKVRDIYFRELEQHLQQFLGASKVEVFRYAIRKRHTEFPVSKGTQYAFAQPTLIAHVDATLLSTMEEIVKRFGDGAKDLSSKRHQWVNVWKPLRGPVNDWPLCFCDASSVHPEDIETTDMVYADYFTENQSLRFNSEQKWFYLSDHQPDEIIIFKQSDSDSRAVGGVPHCSFANPAAHPEESPRESIEARALVFY
ncbi:Putative hydroxylase/desaturase AsaB [Septoria linicola]|uniref:Hydroxylase/desaturase AsaB n=1 Tax=Septoria linicola TaxID=215465 RepID=A0A9Q9ELW4_9PEZI|nr:putative hydroxylase/desaturase AsaB [Septoria linicola]USW56191.1 Putative hydroxylase/desaturase AsaB [Septoria linicola]